MSFERFTFSSMAIDPFIRQIYNSSDIPRNGWTRVCADDIGCVLRRLAHLARLLPIFKVAQRFAGLHLKPAKCVIVPLGNKFSDQLRNTLQQWLRYNIPRWEFFTISATGKYLGFALGPSARNETWTKPMRVWKQRVCFFMLLNLQCRHLTFTAKSWPQ